MKPSVFKQSVSVGLMIGVALLGLAAPAAAQDSPSADAAPTTQPAGASATTKPAAMPSLIQKLPDYSGDWWSREYLTGDWGGARTELAEHGILFDFDLTQIIQGNAHGGKDTNNAFRYSGSVDFKLQLDTARMGLWPGGLITLRGETIFGQSVNTKAGAISPVNTDALFPFPDDSGLTTLSEFTITQALSEKLVITAGKLDVLQGDDNVFAHDERTQFLNTAFRVNPVLFTASPYTAMGAGVILLPTDWLTIATFVMDNDPDGDARRTGFNTAFHGREWLTVSQEYTIKWDPFGKPGHQRFGWYWTSRDFLDFATDSRINLPVRFFGRRLLPRQLVPRPLRALRFGDRVFTGVDLDTKTSDWGVYYNFDQYLYTEPDDPEQGWGVFGRFGYNGGGANIFSYFYSAGLGGKGIIPGRDNDTFGLGYYYADFTNDLPDALNIDSEQGVELFYNIEITPWLHITPDLQVIVDPGGGFGDRDVAIVYGVRAQMTF